MDGIIQARELYEQQESRLRQNGPLDLCNNV